MRGYTGGRIPMPPPVRHRVERIVMQIAHLTLYDIPTGRVQFVN